MKQKLPEKYKHRSQLLKVSLDKGLSASEIHQLIHPMDGKPEEEKEAIAAELLKNLNEQEKELFDKVKACYDEMIQITECQTFIKGFKLGARFFIECFENDADIFDE